MSSPKISVLIPVYNVEKYLEECLNSVCSQTFDDLEIICINDGSTDGSKSIIERFQQTDRRIRLIDKANSGYGASMNQGIKAATGEYLAILESDDFLDLNAFENMYAIVEKFTPQIIKCNYFLYWSQPDVHRKYFEVIEPNHANRLINPQIERFSFDYYPMICSALFERRFILANAINFLETPGASYQDTSFSFKAQIAATRAVFLYEAYLNYRQDNENSSINSPEKTFCICDEFDAIEEFLQARPNQNYLYDYVINRRIQTYLWNYGRLSGDLKPIFLDRMRSEFEGMQIAGHLQSDVIPADIKQQVLTIIRNPKLFKVQFANESENTVQSIGYYLKNGGPLMLARAMLNKTSAQERNIH